MDKNILKTINSTFELVKNGQPESKIDAGRILASNLRVTFPEYDFDVRFVPTKEEKFYMCVIPEFSTINKIIDSIMKNEPSFKTMKKLWKENKMWIIEIDESIIPVFTSRELTALLLHEIGHIVNGNTITNRVGAIIQYELAKAGKPISTMLTKEGIFKKILTIPVLTLCNLSEGKKKNDAIIEEIKADTFAKNAGYKDELITALKKIQNDNKYKYTPDEALQKSMEYSTSAAHQLQLRQANLVKGNMKHIIEKCESPTISSYIKECYDSFFSTGSSDSSVTEEKKMNFLYEQCDRLTENCYFLEFFDIAAKSMKRIEPSMLDYISIKTNMMKTESDKLMLVSYIHNKLDMINYYLELIRNPKTNKKYRIPHTEDELMKMKQRLEQQIAEIVKFRLPDPKRDLWVAYPENYEG